MAGPAGPSAGRRARAAWAAGLGAAAVGLLLAWLLQVAPVRPAGVAPDGLDEAQRAWIAAHELRVGVEQDYPPFVWSGDDATPRGWSVELLQSLQARSGLRLQLQPPQALGGLLDALRARQLDLVTSLRPTPERAAYALFTQPYAVVPTVIVVRAGGETPASLVAFTGRRVAVGAGYAVEGVVRASYPGVAWQPVPDDATALLGVAAGHYAAAVVDLASFGWLARREGLEGVLVASARVGFDYALAFAVRSDWPELRRILDDLLAAMPADERQALAERWLGAGLSRAADPGRAPRATLLGLVLLGGGAAWLLGLRMRGR